MFHKGKRRRRFIALAPTEQNTSSYDGTLELSRVAAAFEPARYELLNDRQAESDESPHFKPNADELASTTTVSAPTVSEASTGEKIFHFGCYFSAARFYLDSKFPPAAASSDEANLKRTHQWPR
jgi:hypothetical protein